MLRRKRLPEGLADTFEAFRGVVERVERGKSVLTEAVPTSRLPGRALADVLLEFEDELREALRGMPSWRTEEVSEVWDRCVDGLETSLQLAHRLRTEGPTPPGFEALIGAIGDLLDPLEVFRLAADRFRELRA